MKGVRIIAIVLLFFVALNALAGGILLMLEPTGSLIQMPFHWIKNSPFDDYFIPGLVLFISNGLLGLATAVISTIKLKGYQKYIALQGLIIVVWIVAQTFMLQMIYWLQFAIGGIGMALMLMGLLLDRKMTNKKIERSRHEKI